MVDVGTAYKPCQAAFDRLKVLAAQKNITLSKEGNVITAEKTAASSPEFVHTNRPF